jgi:hypothetical protein
MREIPFPAARDLVTPSKIETAATGDRAGVRLVHRGMLRNRKPTSSLLVSSGFSPPTVLFEGP